MLIEKAGLILLWPYLRSFFAQLDLLNGLEFKDEAAWERAVIMTYYLAGETEEAEEHLMILPKLLCAWPIEQPVDRKFNVSDKERAEVQDLLESVVSNWSALKNTSIPGFQATFLDRQGKLFVKEDKIELVVERKGVDVLLEKLPWSIASFKLPWLLKPIFIEW